MHRGPPVNVPIRRTAHLFSDIPANDTKESMFGHAEFLCFKENSNFRLQSQNSDTGVNNYGYRLVDFCIDNNLFIINGRGDTNSSNVTCKNVSTVDFFLLFSICNSDVTMFTCS